MKKAFSRKWVSSTQPRKQRKYRYNAPMHVRQKMMHAHVDKILKKQFNIRSIQLRKEDEVKIMRGEFRGTTGKITDVDMKKLAVYVDNIKRKKPSGQEVQIPIEPSNLLVIKLGSDDKERMKAITRKTRMAKMEDAKKEAIKPVKKSN